MYQILMTITRKTEIVYQRKKRYIFKLNLILLCGHDYVGRNPPIPPKCVRCGLRVWLLKMLYITCHRSHEMA